MGLNLHTPEREPSDHLTLNPPPSAEDIKHLAHSSVMDREARAAPTKTVTELEAELAAERVGFDPEFEFSDNHAYWRLHNEKSRRIAHLTAELRMAMEAT